MNTVNPNSIARRFVKLSVLFCVGVAIGLSPLLGTAEVPGFTALIALFPVGIAETLIPTSAFLMGLTALGSYAIVLTRDLSLQAISLSLRRSIVVAGAILVILVIAYGLVVVQVPYDGAAKVATFVVGNSRLSSCRCSDSSDAGCIEELSLKLSAVESCWGSRPIAVNRIILELLYLGLMGSFGTAIGSAVAFEQLSKGKKIQKSKVQTSAPDRS